MGSEPKVAWSAAAAAAASVVAAALALPAYAGDPAAMRPPIYSCIDAHGKKLTSDRLIPECAGRDQRVLNSDGSVNRVVPPPLTADERAEQEQKDRDANVERVQRNDAIRRDRNLMQRFPDEAAHRKAREKALDDVRASGKNSDARIALLMAERKKLVEEAEFYVKRPMPSKLKQALDANDASLEAQRALAQNQQIEAERINALYDAELGRLKKLWAGALPGSLGPLPGPKSAASGSSRTAAAL